MEPGLSIQLVWPMAAEEAAASKFECIEPFHMFTAALKLAEFEDDLIGRLVTNELLAASLLEERDALRRSLLGYGIDVPGGSVQVRRALRERVGLGGFSHDRQSVMHRSSAARELCRSSENIAVAGGSKVWTAADMVEAVMQQPCSEIEDALVDSGLAQPKEILGSVFQAFTRDLSLAAVEGEICSVDDLGSFLSRDPAARVAVEALFGDPPKNVLLIQSGQKAPKDLIETLALFLSSTSVISGSKSKRILQVLAAKLLKEESSGVKPEDRIAELLDAAETNRNLVLWLCAFGRYFTEGNPGLISSLKRALTRGTVRCVASMDQEEYARVIQQNPDLKQSLMPIWLHDIRVPLSL